MSKKIGVTDSAAGAGVLEFLGLENHFDSTTLIQGVDVLPAGEDFYMAAWSGSISPPLISATAPYWDIACMQVPPGKVVIVDRCAITNMAANGTVMRIGRRWRLAGNCAQAAPAAPTAPTVTLTAFVGGAITGKLKSFWSYIKSFLEAVVRAMATVMAQQAAGIFSGMGFGAPAASGPAVSPYGPAPQLPAGGFHSGGLVMHSGGYIPRFHVGGLSSDERAAILQTGEYVVSRKGVAALDRINKGEAGGFNFVMHVDNQTGTPIDQKNTGVKFDGENFVVSVVLKNIEGNGPIRHAITGLGGR